MYQISSHLEFLVGSSSDASDNDKNVLEDWKSVQKTFKDTFDNQDAIVIDEAELEQVPSVLDNYRSSDVAEDLIQTQFTDISGPSSSVSVTRLLQKPNLQPLLEPIRVALSSNRGEDVIFEELTELIGFDDIDLVMDIVQNRGTVAREVRTRADPVKLNVFKSPQLERLNTKVLPAHHLSQEEARRRMEKTFRENAARPLFSGTALKYLHPPFPYIRQQEAPEILPNVYSSTQMSQGNVLSQFGSKYMLPIGTEYEEVIIPPAKIVPPKESERLLPVVELDSLARESFPGKTDVAMLTILRVIDQHRLNIPFDESRDVKAQLQATVQKDTFKIIYVAPMKALASEIVRKLGKRLSWLSIQVRELTGDAHCDMQMTKAEIAQTQIIVTTPEKWDVVTRKPTGEGELASYTYARVLVASQSLKLLIIDEVHLLNEERGAVIETIVARTLRQVESSQSMIRIVGLSATLPNYIDVAEFLCVSKFKGLFYFDSSFRPVPLEQHFIGIKGKAGSTQSKKNLDRVTFLKVSELVAQGHQVMVFVHARKETVKSALALQEAALVEGNSDDFSCQEHPQYAFFRRSIGESRNKEMKQLFDHGFGIHHAGMLRSDRNMMERMFEAKAIKIPIESQFQGGLIDSLNAEISLGTVANVRDADEKESVHLWSVILIEPLASLRHNYAGIAREATGDDPQLGNKREVLAIAAAQKLADARMITFDRATGAFTITDLGRIAAKYYIRHSSVEIFNKEFRQKMSEADVLGMLSMSTEFEQIQVRESEQQELESLADRIPCDVKHGPDTSQGKVNILLQGSISRETVEDFALVSDMAYAMQNGGRIVRALLEIAISRKWASVSAVLMGISKAIEKRMWPFDHPLKQFNLKSDIFYNLQRWADEWSVAQLASLGAADLGNLVHSNEIHGQALLTAAKQFPALTVTYDLRPLGPDVLKISARVKRAFTWSTKVHGTAEPFWLWVEDANGLLILQLAHVVYRQTTDIVNIDFVISIPDGKPPPSVTIRYVSDRWMGSEDEIFIPLDSLIMPTSSASITPLLDLPLLQTSSVVKTPSVAQAMTSRIDYFNAIQTQTYWSLVNTQCNALLCAPVGSGNVLLTNADQFITRTTALRSRESWVTVVAPRRSLAAETVSELRSASKGTGISIEFATGPDALKRPNGRVVRVITASHLLQILSNRNPGPIVGLDLFVCENLELLDSTCELAISLLRHATQSSSTRFVGVSASLNDAFDLADWLDVDPSGLHSFRPRDRDQSLSFSTSTFTIPQSGALFKAMAKPAHTAIQGAPPGEPAIVFVPSRGQCKAIALDLLTQCALEMETERGYLPPDTLPEYVEDYLARLQDTSLIDFVSKGLGFFHEGIQRPDRNLMLEMYAEGLIRVLVVPRDSCWTLPVRATVVVVMGTQYYQVGAEGSDRQLRDYALTELVRMQSRAVRHIGSGYFYLFCQAEAKDTISRFLNEGLPIESQLLETDDLARWFNAQKGRFEGLREQDLLDVLSFTFLARRVVSNPAFYDCTSTDRDENLSRIVDKVISRASELLSSTTQATSSHV
ncbi:hypothetical protein H0H92_004804 [Tricholoma furcatifolium]|nr:hypothetical protein H0H92_004804 [Tricholoma furcatifolium]